MPSSIRSDDDELLDILLRQTVGVDHVVSQLRDRFTVGQVLGEGRFSQVRSATRISDGVKCALKGVALEALEEDEESLEILEAEVNALHLVSNRLDLRQHVVQLHEVIQTAGDSVFLVLSLVSGMELFELVERHGAVPQPIVRTLTRQLLEVISVLHGALNLVHRDIKPENLIVTGLESAHSATLVVIDFGYAAKTATAIGLRGVAGSPDYAAPEILDWLGDEDMYTTQRRQGYGSASDLWSIGVTVYVLLVAAMPMRLPEDCLQEELADAVRNADIVFDQSEWRADGMSLAKVPLTLHCLLLTTYYSLLTPYALRLTPCALLLTPYSLLLTPCYSLPSTTHYIPLLTTYHPLPTTHILLPTIHYLLHTTYYLLPHYSLPTTHYLLPITHYPPPHYPLPTTHYPLLTTHYPLPTTYYPLLTTHYPLLTTHYSLPTTHYLPPHYSLFTTPSHYPLPTTHYPTTHYPLLTTHYPLPTTHYSLPTTHYLLPHEGVCDLMHAARPVPPANCPRGTSEPLAALRRWRCLAPLAWFAKKSVLRKSSAQCAT